MEQDIKDISRQRPRARDIGIRIGIMPTGNINSICDIPSVKIGHTTLVEGHGNLVKGQGPIRTGVTAVIPRDDISTKQKLPCAVDVINGFGKSVGMIQINELGEMETPILLTNTLNVGKVSQHLVEWMVGKYPGIVSVNPVVMECNDSYLNDIQGMHVSKDHVFWALETAGKNDFEGCIGAGMGMNSFGFKAGIGTASRRISCGDNEYILGAIVLNNMGSAGDLRIDGIPVGRILSENNPEESSGSIIMIVGTDAPLTAWSLKRVARRASFGLAKTGSIASHGSGDIALAFSTISKYEAQTSNIMAAEGHINQFFRACIESIEEAIINSLLKAHTVVGRDNNVSKAIDIEILKRIVNGR